jgi:hypothetical protein
LASFWSSRGGGGFVDFRRGSALGVDHFDDFHGGLEARGGRGFVVTENVSKSVDCQVGEVAEFVDQAGGALVAEVGQDLVKARDAAGPKVNRAAVEAGLLGGGADGRARGEALQDLHLDGR